MRQVHGLFNALDVDLRDVQVDHCFISLGTTIRRAGSQQAFRDVDYRMVLDAATWAQGAGAKTIALVSSVGANPNAFAFYPRVKGEVEEALKSLGLLKAPHIQTLVYSSVTETSFALGRRWLHL